MSITQYLKVMLKNYFNIAVRNLLKHKFYSFLNILGLSIGLSCFMLITSYIMQETNFDSHYKDSDQMYRVDFRATLNGEDHISSKVGSPTGAALKRDYPEVINATRLNDAGNWFVKKKGDVSSFKEELVLMADSNFFDFFTTELVYGNKDKILSRPNTLALDLTTSKKIFGDMNPVGEVLVLDNRTDYEVTGVYRDLAQNSHFNHNILLSMSSFEWANSNNSNNWLSTNFNTYIKLKEGFDYHLLEEKFPGMIQTYCAPLIEQFLNMNMEEFENSGNALGFSLFPLEKIHLYSSKEGELGINGDIKYIYIFAAVALFILILACINFMNLSTARSANRAKEVGIRKVMGVYKSQLIYQFISEAVLISIISSLIAYALTFFALEKFNEIASVQLAYQDLLERGYLLFIGAIVLIVGFLAGSYPAFYLSMFKPVEVLKGTIRQGVKSGPIRSVLVVFQFSISIIMIIGTAIVFDQLSFIQNKKLGFEKDQVIIVNDAWILRDNIDAYKQEASRNANVISSTLTSFTPSNTFDNSDLYFKNPSAVADESLVIRESSIDHDFLETLGISLVSGRNFSKDFLTDSTTILINETAARKFGFEDPIGSYLYTFEGDDDVPVATPYKIVGVINDFHFESLRSDISPLVLHLGRSSSSVLFKVKMENAKETISYLNETWDEMVVGQPFEYRFMNEEFNNLYTQENRIGQIFSIFAVLAILIACLGLFGLAAFTAEQKNKEIGIRKTLGASIPNIVGLLSKNFLKLVGISFVIAAPIAFVAMNYWLEDFAYRTSFKPTTFLFSGLLALLVAWVTIGFQSWKAARNNPIKSLRSE